MSEQLKRAVRLTWPLVVLLASACRQQHAAPRIPHEIRYQLDWAWDGIERSAGDSSWQVVNDLGIRVHVTRGYVVSYSMELVECPRESANPPLARLGAGLRSLFETPAYAGHATGTPNPAAIRPMQVESLTPPASTPVGAVLLPPQAYCQVHYLIARAGQTAQGLPKELDMVDVSLHIEGTYQAPGAAAAPFTLHTAAAYGGLFGHAAASQPLRVDTGSQDAVVTVRRHLGRIFNGVDFANTPMRVAENDVLKALIDHTELVIDRMDAHA